MQLEDYHNSLLPDDIRVKGHRFREKSNAIAFSIMRSRFDEVKNVTSNDDSELINITPHSIVRRLYKYQGYY